MKRIISLVLVLVMVLSMAPAVLAYDSPAESSNIHDHFYINADRWTDPIKSTLYAEDGGYNRIEYIDDRVVVEHYDADLKFLSGMELAQELPVYGGVYIGDDYNFLVTGQNNVEEDDSKEVFRITRYTKDWVKVDHASLFGANTVYPFDAGTVRFDRSGDILYIRTCHEMYTSEDGLNHQANVFIALRISDMTITDSFTDVLNLNWGYVSHSFNQFVRVDGETLLAVDHGDYYPRSVVLIKYGKKAGEEQFYGRVSAVNAFPIADSTYHYNDTGVSVGGFECSTSHYLIAGSSAPQTGGIDLMYAHRNIFVTATPKDDFTDEATTVNWLTDFSESDDVTVSPPHLVKLDADRYILVWTENNSVRYCFLDGAGQLVGEIQDGEGDLSDCVPIVDGNRLLWYVTNYSAPVFYEIDISLPCEHDYTTVTTEPTCTEQGYTTYTCRLCGDSNVGNYVDALGHSYASVVTDPTCTEGGFTTHTCTVCGDICVDSHTDALGHDFGPWEQTRAPGCETTGEEQRSCTRCAYTETRIVGVTGHHYESVITGPTCTESGYTTHTCTLCGYSYTDTPTAPLGHECGDWSVIQAPTCTLPGTEQRTCIRCDYAEQRSVAALGHAYESVVTEPDCENQGYTTHTCTRCQDSYVDSYVAALGHPYDEGVVIQDPTETEPGIRRHTCTVCGATSDRVIPALGHTHSYESVTTEPTCTEGGYTTYTCACGDSYVDLRTAALGHVEVIDPGHAATCTEPGLTDAAHCGRCGIQLREHEVIPAAGHHYEAVVTEPGCEAGGFTTRTCSGCGDSYTDTVTPALGHQWHGLDCLRCGAVRENPFTDTDPYGFYFEPVLWAVEQGITTGATATTFDPLGQCQRGQVVTFLWRAAGKPEPTGTDNPFVDVKETDFFYKAVLWAVESGITNGLDATHFGPTAPCNRAQVVTFLWRSVGRPAAQDARNPFTDVAEGQFYYESVLWAVEKGITNGLSATEFGVNQICNRAQIVTFLYRTFAK